MLRQLETQSAIFVEWLWANTRVVPASRFELVKFVNWMNVFKEDLRGKGSTLSRHMPSGGLLTILCIGPLTLETP